MRISDWSSDVCSSDLAKHNLQSGGRALQVVQLDTEVALPERLATGIAELDRALGGGLVEGSATLIGGDPGIGKSTLLLQAAARLALAGHNRSEEHTSELQSLMRSRMPSSA